MSAAHGPANTPRPTAIGPYPIERELGRGGMGVVYLARDMRLDRPVAVKVLPADFARDPNRLARFEREARSLAALNHPNVAAIYSIENAGGSSAETLLVLEYIPGRTLTELVYRGPMPLDEAIRFSLQMTDGIEAAHERGVVHRDLKPDNVRITPDGVAKILDFGLATGAAGQPEPEAADQVHISESATTRAMGLTQFGMVMGTPGYMSPEQARGLIVDKRTDIWAFGCILFEMLTGARAFTGETTSDCIAAVIDKEPDWSLLPVSTPNRLRDLIRRSLTKDPRRRLRDIGDARIELEEILSRPLSGLYQAAATDGSGPTRTRIVARLTLKLPESLPLANAPARAIAVSPDGSSIAYVTGDRHHAHLAVRKLEEADPRQAAGTAGAERPFYSPDSQKVGYFAAGRLRRVPIAGGMPNVLASAPRPQGAVWDATERICFVPDWGAPLVRIAAHAGARTRGPSSSSGSGAASRADSGIRPAPVPTSDAAEAMPAAAASASAPADSPIAEELELLARPDAAIGQQAILDPDVLPGGRYAIASVWTGAHHDDATIAAIDLRSGAIRPLIQNGSSPRFAPTGHIVFARRGTLLAVGFDPDKLEVFGQPQPVVEGILSNGLGGGVHAAFSADGTLVYAPGEVFEPRVSLLVARRGHGVEGSTPTTTPPADPPLLIPDRLAFAAISLSPDGRLLAGQVQGPTDHLWVYDLQRGGSPMRLTFQGDNAAPVFAPDGMRLAFASKRANKHLLVLSAPLAGMPGAGSAEHVVLSHEAPLAPTSFTPDGRFIVFTRWRTTGGCEVCVTPVTPPANPAEQQTRVLVGGPGNSWAGVVSPDGRLLAFVSDQLGTPCIFVQPFDPRASGAEGGSGARWQVTRPTGADGSAANAAGSGLIGGPRWSADGGELMYRAGESLVAVRVAVHPNFMVGRPRPMLSGPYVEPDNLSPAYEVFPDSDRIIVMKRAEQPAPARELCVVLNWFHELARRVPLPQSASASRSGLSGASLSGGPLTGRSTYGAGMSANTTPLSPASGQGQTPRKPPPAPPSSTAGTII
ncbi:MAG: protein kinase [Phycisphaeraceae bacterium]|nr:protein kinase [Phycisphaeraceae bacterium]